MRYIVFFLLSAAFLISSSIAETLLSANTVLGEMKKVADWQLSHPSQHKPTDWTLGAYYTGMMALYRVSQDKTYLEAMREMGRKNQWKLGPQRYHADDHAVGQTYCELYQIDKDPQMVAPTKAAFDAILAHPKTQPLAWTNNSKEWTSRWSWCDSLFMAPAAWIKLSAVTGDKRYLDFADSEWWKTTEYLYDPKEGLFYRDSRYFDKKTPNGQKTFWARGNGWVYGGIARVLTVMPADYPTRGKYIKLFKEMTAPIVKAQQPDGMWRTSLLDPAEVPFGESSGTAFFCFGLAWGINQGILDKQTYWPVVERGWTALVGKVQPDGMLGAVQRIGESPGAVNDQSTEVYGTGAFLLAGSEIYQELKK